MPCSAITLSLATVSGVISVALLGIAFGTDNWMYIRVDRNNIQEDISNSVGTLSEKDQQRFESDGIFRSRTQGLFRTCYPETRPKGVELYLSPVETYCENINYYIPDEQHVTKTFSEERMARLHMARSLVALFVVSFLFIFVAFWTGVVGCWRRSPSNIGTTAALMLFACLFSAGSMGLWHGVQYFEQKKLNEEPFYRSWPPLARKYSYSSLDWSYFMAWLGVGASFLCFVFLSIGAICVRRERRKEMEAHNQLMMPGKYHCHLLKSHTMLVYDWSYFIAWVGVGWVLISALLFVGASVCLKREIYNDKRKNLPYIMPVYQTKSSNGGYGPGYAYSTYNYPGPYYGSQYGPYNY